mgnify:CR=1 FL=1
MWRRLCREMGVEWAGEWRAETKKWVGGCEMGWFDGEMQKRRFGRVGSWNFSIARGEKGRRAMEVIRDEENE